MRRQALDYIADFEHGQLSRRQLAQRLMGLGAAAVSGTAVASMAAGGEPAGEQGGTFNAVGLDHVALSVSDVSRSREFYQRHLGLKVVFEAYECSDEMCFLGDGNRFVLALFKQDPPGLNHYCYEIENYNPDAAVKTLESLGIEVRREKNRVYFKDPDGIEVQITGR